MNIMATYQERKFTLPELKGISKRTIEEHLKLYAGYVKFANLIGEKITEMKQDSEKFAYALGEVQRRFSFEFNGMRNHEVYFASLEGGQKALSETGTLKKAIADEFGSFDAWLKAWLKSFKALAMTRGIGWAMLYVDSATGKLVHAWVDEQHLGQLNGCHLVLGLDMWEHSFIIDYSPADKKKYVEAFFDNLNWEVIEENYATACK
jgi:superoxide dismutase, Fe-Mn family